MGYGKVVLHMARTICLKSAYVLWSRLAWLLPVVCAAFAMAQELATLTEAQIARFAQSHGAIARERLSGWRNLLNSPVNRALSERQKLDLVNDFMNRTRFVSDREHWGKEDYWATPIEFLVTNGGDCEDFSIAKYFTLRALGVPDDKLQITYVRETRIYNQAHMVLAYFSTPEAEPLILDNINPAVLPAGSRNDLVPIYSFNGSGLWLAKELAGRGQSAGSSDRIGLWRDLQSRMKAGK
jgi:predicted transglutaminase-like cysteine proteinase